MLLDGLVLGHDFSASLVRDGARGGVSDGGGGVSERSGGSGVGNRCGTIGEGRSDSCIACIWKTRVSQRRVAGVRVSERHCQLGSSGGHQSN